MRTTGARLITRLAEKLQTPSSVRELVSRGWGVRVGGLGGGGGIGMGRELMSSFSDLSRSMHVHAHVLHTLCTTHKHIS